MKCDKCGKEIKYWILKKPYEGDVQKVCRKCAGISE